MKKSINKILFFVLIGAVTVSCKKKAEEVTTTEAKEVATANVEAVKYSISKEQSIIEWTGSKPTGSHNGVISLDNGVLAIKDNVIESGTFLIDMKSIAVKDIPVEDEGNAKLAGHLSGADFFDVAQFPSAAFEVTGFETKEGKNFLSGNLKMKNNVNNVSIPVTVSVNGDTATITSETFTIDRTKWNVKYGSKSFFDDLGDKFINDDIELKINLVATKK